MNIMKKNILSYLIIAAFASSSLCADEVSDLKAMISDLKDTVSDLEGRLDSVETRSYTDKIQFGLAMRVEANNIDTTYADGSKPAVEDIVYRTKLNLNAKAQIADNLKFTGRLSSYKNWGDSNTDASAFATIDSRQGRTPDNLSTLYVERAYLDYSVTNNFILTLGRQPSSDGPSYQIKEGMYRKGTYDALAFDGAADGIVGTYVFSHSSAIRLAYGTPVNTSNNGSATSTVKDTKVIGLFVDKKFTKIGADNLMQVYYVTAKDFNADASGASGANDVNVGDFDLYGAMFEVKNMAHFDFFIHGAASVAKPNGKKIDGDGNTTSVLDDLGLLTSTAGDTKEKSGSAIWLGARYNMNDWAVGAEYNKGSKNWYSFTAAANDPLNKLATRGNATEVYVSKEVNRNANIRLGYLKINYDYTGSGMHLGAPSPMSSTLGTNAVKEKQNIYLTFNVLF